jgi:hypothetical protein
MTDSRIRDVAGLNARTRSVVATTGQRRQPAPRRCTSGLAAQPHSHRNIHPTGGAADGAGSNIMT